MNIIELARKAWELESLPESEAQELQAFAAAVIKAHESERIAELEAGNHDLRKWIDATGQGVLLQRLAMLESTLQLALDALEIYGSQAPAVNETIAKIKEVLHAE